MSDVTVYAGPYTVEVLPKTVTPPPPPPVTGGAWTQIGNGGSVGAYFRRPVVLSNGDIWAAWGGNGTPDHGSWIYGRPGNQWAKTSPTQGVGFDIGSRENYGAWYDAPRNKVLIAAGAPVAYSQLGDLSFDLATALYTEQWPSPNQLTGGDGAFVVYGDTLYGWGGWSNYGCTKRDLLTGVKSSFGGTPRPQFTRQSNYGSAEEESPRLTYARSGVDNRNGTLWTLANDNDLWLCPLGGQWGGLVPTAGDKPTTLGIVATLVEGMNAIIAWCGKTGMVAAGPGSTLRQTWILDLASLVWSRGPGLPDAVPTAAVMASNNLLSDGISALLTVDTLGGTEVWRYA